MTGYASVNQLYILWHKLGLLCATLSGEGGQWPACSQRYSEDYVLGDCDNVKRCGLVRCCCEEHLKSAWVLRLSSSSVSQTMSVNLTGSPPPAWRRLGIAESMPQQTLTYWLSVPAALAGYIIHFDTFSAGKHLEAKGGKGWYWHDQLALSTHFSSLCNCIISLAEMHFTWALLHLLSQRCQLQIPLPHKSYSSPLSRLSRCLQNCSQNPKALRMEELLLHSHGKHYVI